jgi:hypothetical protein
MSCLLCFILTENYNFTGLLHVGFILVKRIPDLVIKTVAAINGMSEFLWDFAEKRKCVFCQKLCA